MLQKVEEKLKELNKKKSEQYYKKKEADLIAWDLVARKGEPPIVVTDEEYDALVKASNGVATRNSVATLLNIVSVVTLIFGIIGAFLANTLLGDKGFFYAVIIAVLGIVFATILGGVAEAVKLLQQLIDDRTIDKPEEIKPQKTESVKSAPVVQNAVPPVMYQQSVQPVYQTPVYQPPVYQPPVYTQQPSYPSQYKPSFTPPDFDSNEDDPFKANAPMKFDD